MKIVQDEKGNGYVAFTEEEIELIKKEGCIKFEANSLRKFASHLIGICAEVINNLPKTKDNEEFHDGEEIETLK